MKELFEKIEELNQLIKTDPNDAEYYLDRGILKTNPEYYKSSIADFDKAIELNPNSSDLYLHRANAKRIFNEIDEALLDIEKAIEINDKNEYAFFLRGVIKYQRMNLDTGEIKNFVIGDLSKAIELNPNLAEAYYWRGIVKSNEKIRDSGTKDLLKAKELGYIKASDFILWKSWGIKL